MVMGGAVSLLLLLGGPQAPLEDRPTSGSGPLAERPIEIGDPGDMGGGGIKLHGCQVRGSGSKWYVSYMLLGKRVDWRDTFATQRLAQDWVDTNCE